MKLRFFRRIRFFRRRATLDRELEEELEFHRAMKQQENEGNGLAAAEARRAIDPELILPYTQNFPHNLDIAIRSTLPPSTRVSAIRQQIAQIDPATYIRCSNDGTPAE